MKRTFFMAMLLVVSVALSGCTLADLRGGIRPSRTTISEDRDVDGFTGLDLRSVGQVKLTQGSRTALTISGPDNIVPLIHSTVRNGVLVLEMEPGVRLANLRDEQVTYTIEVVTLDTLTLSGLGKIEADALSADDLAITMGGAGAIDLGQLKAETLRVTLAGLGDIALAGESDSVQLTLSGSGAVEAGDLRCGTANVTLSGLGHATLWVTDALSGVLSGAGNISYYGSPTTNVTTTGLGDLQALGTKDEQA